MSRARTVAACLLLAAVAGCDDGPAGPTIGIRVDGAPIVEDTVRLSLSGALPRTGSVVRWTTRTPGAITLLDSTAATVRAVPRRAGRGSVVVTADGVEHEITLDLRHAKVTALTLGATGLALVRGEAVAVDAAVLTENGKPSTERVAWSTSDSAVARVDHEGHVYAWGEGSATVAASIGGAVATLPVSVALPPEGEFHLTTRLDPSLPPVVAEVLEGAVRRIQRVVVGDLPDVLAYIPSFCGGRDAPEPVDDVVIYVRRDTTIGGNVLATGGPCVIARGFPVAGLVSLGESLIARAQDDPVHGRRLLEAVLVHEIGHALGIGTMWHRLVDPPGIEDTHYHGERGVDSYFALGFPSAIGVPVERTARAHWRSPDLSGEVMNPYANVHGAFSRVTAAALADLGYVVDLTAAEPWAPHGLRPGIATLRPPTGTSATAARAAAARRVPVSRMDTTNFRPRFVP